MASMIAERPGARRRGQNWSARGQAAGLGDDGEEPAEVRIVGHEEPLVAAGRDRHDGQPGGGEHQRPGDAAGI